MSMSLEGKAVLITRRPEQAGEMIEEIERLGGRAVIFPSIEIIDPESWRPVDEIISRLDQFDAIVFASSNAAERFLGRCGKSSSARAMLRTLEVVAVGQKTRETVERFGIKVTLVPESHSARGLARSLGSGGIHAKRFLIPRGDLAREELPRGLQELGASVETVTVYRTILPRGAERDVICNRILRGEIDIITFASPSAVNNFTSLFSREELVSLASHVAVAVIGPTTEEAARDAGLRVNAVAHEPTARELIHAAQACSE
jgi:uroporphyrinogen-III synthase